MSAAKQIAAAVRWTAKVNNCSPLNRESNGITEAEDNDTAQDLQIAKPLRPSIHRHERYEERSIGIDEMVLTFFSRLHMLSSLSSHSGLGHTPYPPYPDGVPPLFQASPVG